MSTEIVLFENSEIRKIFHDGEWYYSVIDVISLGTFGLTTADHKKLKSLGKHPLRDNMSVLELIFTMLGEETTRQIAIKDDAQGYDENEKAARSGGEAAGASRKRLEKKTGLKVLTGQNFLKKPDDS